MSWSRCAVARVQGVGGCGNGAEDGKGEHQPAQMDTHRERGGHGLVRARRPRDGSACREGDYERDCNQERAGALQVVALSGGAGIAGVSRGGRLLRCRQIEQAGGLQRGRRAGAVVAHGRGHAGVARHGHGIAQWHLLATGLGDEARAQAVRGIASSRPASSQRWRTISRTAAAASGSPSIAAPDPAEQRALRDAAGIQPGLQGPRRRSHDRLGVLGPAARPPGWSWSGAADKETVLAARRVLDGGAHDWSGADRRWPRRTAVAPGRAVRAANRRRYPTAPAALSRVRAGLRAGMRRGCRADRAARVRQPQRAGQDRYALQHRVQAGGPRRPLTFRRTSSWSSAAGISLVRPCSVWRRAWSTTVHDSGLGQGGRSAGRSAVRTRPPSNASRRGSWPPYWRTAFPHQGARGLSRRSRTAGRAGAAGKGFSFMERGDFVCARRFPARIRPKILLMYI